jgi:CRP-like cAMP-binding protein
MLKFQQKGDFLKKYSEILMKCDLFRGIEENNIEKMLSCLGAKIISLDKKYTIFAEGSPAKYIGIMLSGSAQIFQVDYNGNRNILSSIETGEVFAEAFACAEIEALPVTIIANEPSEVMLIDSNRVLYTCSNNCDFHRQLIFNLMKNLATKTLKFHQKIEITSKRTTREKLLTYLSVYSKNINQKSFTIPFDRQELADYLEVERSGLSMEISKLKKDGIINSHKNYFELL